MPTKILPRLLTGLVLGLSSAAYADHAPHTFGSGAAGALTTLSAATLPAGQYSLGWQLQMLGFERFSDSELSAYASADEHVLGLGQLIHGSLSLAYGLNQDVTLIASLPYVSRRDQREAAHGHGEAHGHDDDSPLGGVLDAVGHAADELSGDAAHDEAPAVRDLGAASGLGDLLLLGQYRWFNNATSGRQSAWLLGLKLPTGRTDARDGAGARMETHHQPGSGSWDALVGVAFSQVWSFGTLDSNVLYTHTGNGSQDTRLGQGLAYNLSFSRRIGSVDGAVKPAHHHHAHQSAHEHAQAAPNVGAKTALSWDLMLELNGEWRDRERQAGGSVANTGGNLLYIAPGIRLGRGSWSGGLSLGVPIVTSLYGIQGEPDYRLLFSVGTSL